MASEQAKGPVAHPGSRLEHVAARRRASIQEITETADIGFGSFHNHFDRKEQLHFFRGGLEQPRTAQITWVESVRIFPPAATSPPTASRSSSVSSTTSAGGPPAPPGRL